MKKLIPIILILLFVQNILVAQLEKSKKNEKYGYVDKQGNIIIPYKYIEAEKFQGGFAKVKLNKHNYLIDPAGREYLLAEDINSLTSKTLALDLNSRKLTEIPQKVFNYQQLKVLLLARNKLTFLPPEIGSLTNLTELDLSENLLVSLPNEILNLKNIKADNWFEMGQQLYGAEKYIKALLCYLKTIEKDVNYKYAYGNAGLCYRLLGNNKKALQYLNKRLDLDEKNSWTMSQLRHTYSAMGEYKKAYEVTKMQMEFESNNYGNYYDLSFFALFVNKPLEAIEAAKKSLEIAPEKTGVYTNLALGYVLNNEFEKAKPIYLKWKDKHFANDERTCNEIFLQDIKDLEAAGIRHKDFKKVQELLE